MNSPAQSRQLILDRIRAATAVPTADPKQQAQPTYIRHGSLEPEQRIGKMIERLREYDAEVVECAPENLPQCIADCLQSSGRHIFVAPPGLPPGWLAPGVTWKIDTGLSPSEIEACDGVVTTSFCGVADSGTIVLHHSAAEGRRVLTLLPDWHLCILRASQVVETLPEYFDRCAQPPSLATYISGPSATADIEMTRIKGVHGPRFLNVLLVHDQPTPDYTTAANLNGALV
ncbi:MAG: lactate utilization protein C [Terracidiphilus sp.]